MHKAETNEHDNARARAAVVLAHFLWAPGSGAGTVDRQGSCTPTSEHAFGRQAIDCWNGRSQGVSRGAAVRETLAHAPLNHVELHRHTLLLSSRAALYLRDQRSHCEQAGAESPRSHSSRVGCGLLIVCCSIVPG